MTPPYRESDFTMQFCRDLMSRCETIDDAAQMIAADCVGHNGQPVMARTVRPWISKHVGPRRLAREARRAANLGMGVDMSRPDDPSRTNRIDDLIERANVPIEAIGAIRGTKLKAYGGFMKGADGQPVKVPLYSTTISIDPPNPDFPVIQPAPTTTIAFLPPPRILRKTRSIAIISDMQIGFLRDTQTQALEPIHDPLSIDVAQQIVADVGPSELVFIGDVVDLPMFSRWEQMPEFQRTFQESVNEVHDVLGRFISAAGARCTRRRITMGNHDIRVEKSVLAWNKEALGVRRAGVPDGWPVFSIGYLARFDDLGIETAGQYPGSVIHLLDDLACMHAPPKSKEFTSSIIHGHTHKLRRDPVVFHSHKGRQVHYVADVGCLCRTDATADKHRLLVTNTPSDRARTDWCQGVGIVNIVDDASGPIHAIDLIEIVSPTPTARVAIMGGAHYRSRATEAAA